jgi:hypothetical protein
MSSTPMCDDTRNAGRLEPAACPTCGRYFCAVGRGVYCSPACRQRAFRLRRHQARRPALDQFANHLRRQRRLIDQTVYECPSCQQRFLRQRRCDDCNLMCRNVGLGGECYACNELTPLTELLQLDFEGGDHTA